MFTASSCRQALVLITAGVSCILAQGKLEFEVASIRPAVIAGAVQNTSRIRVDGAMLVYTGLNVTDIIELAYQVKTYQVDGPATMAVQRFDINAKLPEGTGQGDTPAMLQSLLIERFGMKLHRVKKDFPVYGINIAKGDLKMKESALDEVPAGGAERAPSTMTVTGGRLGITFRFSRGAVFQFGDNRVEGRKLSMTQLAQCLSRFMDKPVVDQTSLKGTYDLTLDLSSEDSRAMELRSAIAAGVTFSAETLKALELSSNDSLMSGMQKIGLKLESRKAPLEVLVIDSIRKTPTEN